MMPDGTVEHASGKGSQDENFPVGSLLIAAPLRRHVHTFYRFARNADDVADATDLTAEEKLRRLDRMADVLNGAEGPDAPAAAMMRVSLRECAIDPIHCHELLDAFRQDATKTRYADWGELMDYCRLSAAPVGRYLLDLHGESRDTWPASDALCAALQVINHLQDCAKDFLKIDRVYIPADWMAEDGTGIEDLRRPAATPGLRRTLDRAVAATRPLVEQARRLPGGVKDRGLRAESAIIVALAERLLQRLDREDPLAKRVKLGPAAIAMAAAGGIFRSFLGGRS
ncbi:squalene synthase HpnC [Telmatospirillum siberiense]|uniref:Squalene synthase HpnC n=1 Tax=Telmatospirillum siberiense TaxID=382514 RepID=A0A2N3PXB5_9PROT|nr:squalene synthase HpnC [Telmatospirillum siberiense]PKU25037.1 squalene synthase HpnC [Telmatospirillum siberiense]